MENEFYTEPSRTIPVIGEYDVLVCGGGPAGCAAAIAAARQGMKTLLADKDGYLGGATVSQLVSVILSTNASDFVGIWHEYARALEKRNAIRPFRVHDGTHRMLSSAVDTELVKFVWDDLCTAAGVTVLHHSYASRAIIRNGKAAGAVFETKAGRRALYAQRVIDTTGDGTVAAESGCSFDCGDGEHPWAMAMTKVFRMGNISFPCNGYSSEDIDNIRKQLSAAITRGEYTSPVILEMNRVLNYLSYRSWESVAQRHELLSVLSRILKVDPLDPFDVTRAEREGREQARQSADFYRRYVPGFENAYFLDTSAHIGVRSSRRIRGIATITDDDAWALRKRSDAIAPVSWDIDVWPADSYDKPAVPRDEMFYQERQSRVARGDHYDIPYGAIVAADVDNLYMGGRCISAGHRAESSLRIQQTCMATGEAAGIAAAVSIMNGTSAQGTAADIVCGQLKEYRLGIAAYNGIPNLNDQRSLT